MVIRVNADESQWLSMKDQIHTNTNAFEMSLYNLVIEGDYHDDNDIQRVEVKLPAVVSKEERHAIYKRSSKNKFKAVREGSCMRIFMSKAYIIELLQQDEQHEIIAIVDDIMNAKIDDSIDTSMQNIQNIQNINI